jgi:hypothetical protein
MAIVIPTRNGIPSTLDAARELCRLLNKYRTIIVAVSGNDEDVIAALDAALAACQALDLALEALREYGD